jgi:thioredoxin reductase (NADPH)
LTEPSASERPASVRVTRRDQIYPHLTAAEIVRLRPFGAAQSYAAGAAVMRAGEVGHGLLLVLSGRVAVLGREGQGEGHVVATHDAGAFMGELAQLSGRPALVDAIAETDVDAVAIPPERLRALLIAEAALGERIMRALILRRVALLETGSGGPIILGSENDGDVRRLIEFLRRNGHPHQRLDPAIDVEAHELVARFHIQPEELPIVVCPGGQLLRNPTEGKLARCLGLVSSIDPSRVFDVAIVGAGPAGLATAVYAGSEGLSVLVLDCRAFGGQAGASSRIENYLGFPTGISGMALMARAYNQAQKFGVEFQIPSEATRLFRAGADGYALALADGDRLRARTVVIASGARYRRLALPELERFETASVHYWASPVETRICAGQEVALVGGGNSAGQAVVYLAGLAAKVWLLVRGPGLEASMSRYLIERIAGLPNVEVVTHAEISGLDGRGGELDEVAWRDARSGAETRRPIRHLFLFIGAEPNTDWLADSGIALDARGFVEARSAAEGAGLPLETNLPGVFAVGDVRSSSVKRVAAAVGEGAQVVAALHKRLADGRPTAAAVAPHLTGAAFVPN